MEEYVWLNDQTSWEKYHFNNKQHILTITTIKEPLNRSPYSQLSTGQKCTHIVLLVNDCRWKSTYISSKTSKKFRMVRVLFISVRWNGSLCTYWPLQNKSILQSKHQQWHKIPPLKAFMEMHRMGSIKSISAHMHSPWGVIRSIWTKFPHIHQACWNTIDFKSCFWMADLTWGSLLPLCWHKFTSTIEPRGDQMRSLTNHSLSR